MTMLSRPVDSFSGLLALATPLDAWAQSAGIESPTTPPSPATEGAVAVVAVVVATLFTVGIVGKLYDLKHKRKEDEASLESQISDAVLLDSNLAAFPITVSARTSLWRWPTAAVEITGTVPTPELRDAVIRLIKREVSHIRPGAQTEDRIVIDPRVAP